MGHVKQGRHVLSGKILGACSNNFPEKWKLQIFTTNRKVWPSYSDLRIHFDFLSTGFRESRNPQTNKHIPQSSIFSCFDCTFCYVFCNDLIYFVPFSPSVLFYLLPLRYGIGTLSRSKSYSHVSRLPLIISYIEYSTNVQVVLQWFLLYSFSWQLICGGQNFKKTNI